MAGMEAAGMEAAGMEAAAEMGEAFEPPGRRPAAPATRALPTRQRVARAARAERAAQALELRARGLRYRDVAAALGCAVSTAYELTQQALAMVLREPTEALVALEVERLDAVLRVLWPRVLRGHLGAIDRWLAVSERRAKLLGLDRPAAAVLAVAGQVEHQHQHQVAPETVIRIEVVPDAAAAASAARVNGEAADA